MDRLAGLIGIAYLYLILSRVLDLTLPFLHIPMILLIILSAISIPSGVFFRGITSRLGIALTLLVAWMGVTVPFSQWKGGSTPVYMIVLQCLMLGICVIGIGRTVKDAGRLMRTVALAGLTAALLSFAYGMTDNGRLVLDSGTFRDPNIYAMFLVLTVPMWLWMSSQAISKPRKVAMFLALGPILYALLRTGSRGGAIGLIAMLVSVLMSASLGRKLAMLAGVAALLVVANLTLPDYIRLRYFTLFEPSSSENINQQEQDSLAADMGSSEGRLTLLVDSIKLTMAYPIFGVGLDQFSQTNWLVNHAKRGNGPGAMVTHNTYTQVSSETGIPGLILLLVVYFQSFRSINSVIRQNRAPKGNRPDIVEMAVHLRHCLIAVAVCSFFLSVGYGPLLYVIVGVCGAAYAASNNEARGAQPETVSAPVGPVMMWGVKPNRFQTGVR